MAELETRIAALESQAAVQSRTRGDMTDQLADLNMAQQVCISRQLIAAVLSAGIQQRTYRCLAHSIILTG